jgi:FlaA1/EpsC-like NDP-sugar epimerase
MSSFRQKIPKWGKAKVFVSFCHQTDLENSLMQEKTILITGANAGIGWSTAKALAARGAHLLIHARNETKAQQSREDLLDLYPKARIQA